MRARIAAAVVVVFSAACGGQHEVCAPHQAQGLGKAQALRGEPMDTSLGGRCSGSEAHVQAGYDAGRREMCDPEAARRDGWSVGTTGAASYGVPARFRLCGDLRPFQAAFDTGYGQGMRDFCGRASAGAHQAGFRQGAAGQPRVPQALPPLCGQDQVQQSVAEYERGHRDGLARFCSPQTAQARGNTDGRMGRAALDANRLFAACDAATAKRLHKEYITAHKAGLGVHCASARIVALAQAAARDGAEQSSLPFEFAVCPASTGAQYDAAFAKERDRYMASQCTYDKGAQVGRAHARMTNERQLAMPSFCDRQKFASYEKGYKAGWKEAKAALCSEVEATQRGVEDGQAGRPLSYQPPALCPANLHSRLLAAYREGHKSVPRPTTPTVIVVTEPAPAPATDAITWETDATRFRGQVGSRFMFTCPPGRIQSVWGSDIYSDDSSLCSAAVHAGVITTHGGPITIEMRSGLTSYRGSKRNKVASKGYGPWEGSFVVLGATGGGGGWVDVVTVPSDPNESARAACINAGYAPSSCDGVTSANCIRKGYSPSSCRLPTRFLAAIDVCLDSGYSPSSCRDVTVAMCIRKGYGPSSCQLPTRHLAAVEACLEAGYTPSSCKDVADAQCIRRGNIPSNCGRVASHPGPPPGHHGGGGGHGDDDDDDDGASQGLYTRCVTWADERYRRAMSPVDARDNANAKCKGIRDLEVAEFVYEKASRGSSPSDAMDLALDAGKRRMGRKLDLLRYVVEKYSRSMSPVDAVKRGIAGVERVSHKARSCVESNYDAYSRGTSPSDAMDRSLQQCQK